MKTKAEIAVDVFNNGFNCAQAVLMSHCGEYGLSDDVAKKLSCGFGGGMGSGNGGIKKKKEEVLAEAQRREGLCAVCGLCVGKGIEDGILRTDRYLVRSKRWCVLLLHFF